MRQLIVASLLLSVIVPVPQALGEGKDVPLREALGVDPIGSYLNGATEVVNLYNGNTNVSIPLLNLRGRNGSSVVLSFAYNTKQIVRRKYSDGIDDYFKYEFVYDGPQQGRWVVSNFPGTKCVYDYDMFWDGTQWVYYIQPRWIVTGPDGAMHETHPYRTDLFMGNFESPG